MILIISVGGNKVKVPRLNFLGTLELGLQISGAVDGQKTRLPLGNDNQIGTLELGFSPHFLDTAL
jgi:hypothetical protein